MSICKQWIHGFEWRRLPNRVALAVVDTDLTQGLEDLVAFDKFGNGTLTHHSGNVSDGFNRMARSTLLLSISVTKLPSILI